MRQKFFLLNIFLLILLYFPVNIVYAQIIPVPISLEPVITHFSTPAHYDSDQNTYFTRPLLGIDLHHNPDGTMDILVGGVKKSSLGLIITGTILGQPTIIDTTTLNWSWSYDENFAENKYLLTGTARNAQATFIQIWDFNRLHIYPKMTFSSTNNSLTLNNTVFWFVNFLQSNDVVRFNSEDLTAGSITRDTNVATINPIVQLNEAFEINYIDLIRSGFTLNRSIFGRGTVLGRAGFVMANGFQSGNGDFLTHSSIRLDPTLLDTNFQSPTLGTNTSGWSNANAVGASDNNYATSTTLNAKMDSNGFDFSSIPNNAKLMSIQISLEGNTSGNCDTGVNESTIEVELTADSGTTYTDSNHNITLPCANDSSQTMAYSIYDYWQFHDWNTSNIGTAKFRARLEVVGLIAATTANVDQIKVKFHYFSNSPLNGIQTTDSIFHLAISDENTGNFIHRNNTALYITGDLNFDTSKISPDLSPNMEDHGFFASRFPKYYNDGKIGGALDFNGGVLLYGNDYADFSPDTNLTIMGWANSDVNNLASKGIINHGNTAAAPDYTIESIRVAGAGTNKLRFITTSDQGITNICTSNTTIVGSAVVQNWFFFAVTYDGNQKIVYMNGVDENHCAFSAPLQKSTFIIGNGSIVVGNIFDNPNYSSGWDGRIDELMLLDSTLSASQIMQVYLNGTSRFPATGFKILTSQSIGSTQNTIDVITDSNSPTDSNFTTQEGDFNGVYQYTLPAKTQTPDDNTVALTVHTPTNFSLKYFFNAGSPTVGDTNAFITPQIKLSPTINAGTLPCNYIYGQDFNISCASACTINENVDLNNFKIIFNNDAGAGICTLNFDVNNWSQAWVENTCQVSKADHFRSS